MRFFMRLVGWVGLLGVIAASAGVGWVVATHPRDKTGYIDYVRTLSGPSVPRPAASFSDSELIGAGDRACEWLGHQVPGLWRTRAPYQLADRMEQYARAMPSADRAFPITVVAGAWAYLCPATAKLVKSHYIFDQPAGD